MTRNTPRAFLIHTKITNTPDTLPKFTSNLKTSLSLSDSKITLQSSPSTSTPPKSVQTQQTPVPRVISIQVAPQVTESPRSLVRRDNRYPSRGLRQRSSRRKPTQKSIFRSGGQGVHGVWGATICPLISHASALWEEPSTDSKTSTAIQKIIIIESWQRN